LKNKIPIFIVVLCLAFACRNKSSERQNNVPDSSDVYDDDEERDTIDVFSNERFRNVFVEKIGDSTFKVSGQAQVFEAAFSWTVEDDQGEIKKGHAMTNAGAPEWGNFEFETSIARKDSNSVLHLILFESSPKDGSRQHELPIPLY
jgi:hypothetical protein